MSVRPLATPLPSHLLASPPPTRTVAILPFQLLQNARNERWENVGEHRPSGPSGVSPPLSSFPLTVSLSMHAGATVYEYLSHHLFAQVLCHPAPAARCN